jgi:hypothetical protein
MPWFGMRRLAGRLSAALWWGGRVSATAGAGWRTARQSTSGDQRVYVFHIAVDLFRRALPLTSGRMAAERAETFVDETASWLDGVRV